MFFTWCFRTFAPRRYFVKRSIEASNRVMNVVLDTRGGQANRDKIKKQLSEVNAHRGSKYFRSHKK